MKINKYFLLHNKKLKPWIKYWLYIKSKDKNYVLSDILQGTSFYLENSSNKKFNLFQINGNSMQDGTPTPTNPVEIKSAGDNNIKIIISNENLFNMDGKPSEDRLSSAGYTLKYNDDKTITINGTGTGTYKFLSWDLTLEAGTYIASGCPSGGSQNGYSFLIRVGNSSYWDYGNGVSFTLTAKTTIQVCPIRIGSTIPTFNNVTFKPMIRLASSSSTSFVPHQEQNISIPCQQPMRSIGNVRDSFVKQDGVWYEKHNIGVIENYNGETITTDFISTTGSLSTGAFVQYVLDDANYIECTQEQITELEKIKDLYTYENTTNINSQDVTPPYLRIQYWKNNR